MDSAEKKVRRKLSGQIRSVIIRSRAGLRRFYTGIPVRMRWVLIVLSSISLLALLAVFIITAVSSSEKNQIPKERLAMQVGQRLHGAADAIRGLRDSLISDSIFTLALTGDSPTSALFDRLHYFDSLAENNFSELFRYLKKDTYLKARGVAYYDAAKHLTAWDASNIGVPNFDTVFAYAPLLEKHSKTILLDNEQIFSWIVATRKIISKEGALLGFVTAKAMIGERFPLYGPDDHGTTIFDDIIKNSGRDVQCNFSPPAKNPGSNFLIYVDPNDSTTLAASLSIGDIIGKQQNRTGQVISFIRDLTFVLLIFIFIWLAAKYVASTGSRTRTIRSKLIAIGSAFLILACGRILLLITGALSAIFPQTLQDPQDFSLPSIVGLFSNPLQLFTTIFFATTFLALIWVVFVPEKPEWKYIPAEPVEEEPPAFSTFDWLAKIGKIIGIILLLPLLNFLFSISVNTFVQNSSFHYIDNRFGFTRGSFVLMQASLLLTGLSYFFLALMILLWILRSMIRFTASELTPTRSYFAHYIFFIVLTTLAAWGLSPDVLGIYPEMYWISICVVLCVLTIIIFTRDLNLLRSPQRTPSLFFRTPRSGLALLFLLCGAGFLVSPLVATREYADEQEIVKQNLRHNSETNILNYSSLADQLFLSLSEDEAAPGSITESEVKNLAFNLWLKKFSDVSNNNIVIQIQNSQGKILSHFAQNVTTRDETRLSGIKDSLFAAFLQDNKKNYLVASEPCFTASCTPAIIGIGYINVSGASSTPDSLGRYILSIAFWNDLFPQPASHSLYDIVRKQSPGDKLIVQNVFYGQYKNDILQNTNTSAIELPSRISPVIDSALFKDKSGLDAKETITAGKRSFTIYSLVGGGERIISATIFIPGLTSLIELTLSLNTVSLFIGFFLIFFALLVRSLFSKDKSGALKFRDRIFLIVLTIALVPLVIVTNITRRLLIEREQRIEREHLQRDAEIIAVHLQPLLSKRDSASSIQLSSILADLSNTIGRDISIFNNHGILLATNRPELYESSLLPNQISSEVERQLLRRQRSFTIEPLTSASGNFDIGFKSIESPDKDGLIGIAGVTSFRGERIIEADIAGTIELMYGAFAALGIILLLIGAWISVRIAAPLQQLIGATERVTEGRLETIVNIKRKDEVGELAQAFNRMTRELERTRENVAQSEREGAWKEMARQVAHEIKNPLTPMKLSIQHVNHAYEANDTNFGSVFRRVIRTLSEQIEVLTRIATEFSRFGEMPRRKYGFVSLKKIAESAVALYDAERSRIRFVIDIPADLPPIYADDEEFRRALVNLTRNSLQATEGWGVILIRARERNGLIHLDFSDTGGGMAPETVQKAFDPNFSTKTSGMGLGLAIVKKIITDMSGTISVESRLGKGTTFHIELPAREYPNE